MSKTGLTAILCLLFAGGLIAGQASDGLATANALVTQFDQVNASALDPDHAPDNLQAPQEYYQLDAVTWATRASKPGTAIYCSDWGAYERYPDSSFLYCIGGQSPYQTACYRYNSSTNTWWTMAARPSSGCNMTSVYWKDDGGGTDSSGVFVLGRYAGGYYTTCLRWWQASNTWTTFTSYGSSQSYAGNAACVIGDSIFLKWNNSSFSRYSIREGSWASRPTSGMTGTYYGSACAHLGKAYFGGGWSAVQTFQCYDPVTASWSTKASIPGSAGGNRPMIATWSAGVDRIYCWGGGNGWSARNGVYWYDASSDVWTAEGTMPGIWLGAAFGPVEEFPGPNDIGIHHATGYNGSYNTAHWRGEPDVPMPDDVGVIEIVSPADPFYAFGDTFTFIAKVKNFGTAAQTGVPVHCILRERTTEVLVYDETEYVDLAVGETKDVTFPLTWAPPATETVYVDTMRTELTGDGKPSNDMMVAQHKVTEWGSECISYNDGTFDNAISWVAAGNELTERFFAPVTPLAVNKATVWLSSFSGNDYAAEIRLYGNDGTPYGYPGTTLATWTGDLHTSIWTSLYYNEIMFDPAVSVTYDTFFVSYYQTSVTPAYPYCGMDYTPPIETQNDWGKYNGVWGLFPYDGNMDFGIEACYQARLLDGAIVDIPLPPATIDSGAADIYPQIVVKNVGLKARTNIPVEFYITPDDPLDPSYYEAGNSGPIDVGEEVAVDFVAAFPPETGTYMMTGISMMPYDTNTENDTLNMPLWVRYLDVRVELVSPRLQEVPGLVPVRVRLVNIGNVAAMVPRVDVTIMPSGYADWRENIAVDVGSEQIVTFNPWVCPAGGTETYTAWFTYPEDMNHGTMNDGIWCDTASHVVKTGIPGWTEMTPMPAPPSGKYIKDGGCLAYDVGMDKIYASKGYKTGDFYDYDVDAGTWTNLTTIPLGAEGKPPYKGSVICSDGNGMLYLTKGNNTVGFWEYDATLNTWTQKTNVPTGASGKKVKQGAGIAWSYASIVGRGCAYLLKGYRNEFYRYDPTTNEWTTLLNAPIGTANKIKWNDGSWLVADPDGQMLYAFKSKYHEFYKYDTDADTWSHALSPMPIPGSAGNKKAKTGSSAAWYGDKLYAFKGGNTNEFWRYWPMADSWQKQDDIPLYGYSGSRKKVKAGAALAGHPGTGVYGFKGNKSLEFWRYTPYDVVASAQPRRDGITAGATEIGAPSFAIAPNPLAGGFATVRYSLPRAGLATLNVFDVTGRTVLEQTLAAGRTGTASLDLRKLEAGVYLVKVTTEGFSTTQKLVVEH